MNFSSKKKLMLVFFFARLIDAGFGDKEITYFMSVCNVKKYNIRVSFYIFDVFI